MQAELAGDAEYLPDSHAVQVFHPSSEYSPAAQSAQIPVDIYCPAAQQRFVNVNAIGASTEAKYLPPSSLHICIGVSDGGRLLFSCPDHNTFMLPQSSGRLFQLYKLMRSRHVELQESPRVPEIVQPTTLL